MKINRHCSSPDRESLRPTVLALCGFRQPRDSTRPNALNYTICPIPQGIFR